MDDHNEVLGVFSDVVNDDVNSIILDFEEIFLLANNKLPKEKKVDINDFLKWLNDATSPKIDNPLYDNILQLYNLARIEQKQAYIKFLTLASSKNWQKYAWLLERKYSDLNLQHKIDIGDGKKIIIERPNQDEKKD